MRPFWVVRVYVCVCWLALRVYCDRRLFLSLQRKDAATWLGRANSAVGFHPLKKERKNFMLNEAQTLMLIDLNHISEDEARVTGSQGPTLVTESSGLRGHVDLNC